MKGEHYTTGTMGFASIGAIPKGFWAGGCCSLTRMRFWERSCGCHSGWWDLLIHSPSGKIPWGKGTNRDLGRTGAP